MRCDLTTSFTRRNVSCFNPHTYMRCDSPEAFENDIREVSIHTPTWGVTSSHHRQAHHRRVSIHTPTWGVTYRLTFPASVMVFQSTHLHEVWLPVQNHLLWEYAVSIHTPTWGVTLCWITYYQPASLINYYANRYYFFDFTTQNCSINKLIYWFLTPAKLLFFL